MNFPYFKKPLSVGVLPVAAVLLLVACSKPAPLAEPVRAVKVLTVGAQTMTSIVEFAGEVRPRIESRLGFRVGGKLMVRAVDVGQHVKAGQLLAQLDPEDYRLAATAAKAQLAAAATNRDLAGADYQRFKALKEQNFISGAELERRDTSLKAAQAQFEQAQAQFSSQGNQTAYTRLVADVAGVVTSVEAESGQVVAAGTPVVRIAQDGPRDVVFSVPEDKVSMIKMGSAVTVQLWATNVLYKGVVREVGGSADPVTRTFLIKASLAGVDAPALGSTVVVVPQALQRGAGAVVIKLPTTALHGSQHTSAVWVLDPASMTVALQRVQIATADGNEVVISRGLQPGMQVVSAGVHVLSPGQKVTIYKENKALPVADNGPASVNSNVVKAPVVVMPASAVK